MFDTITHLLFTTNNNTINDEANTQYTKDTKGKQGGRGRVKHRKQKQNGNNNKEDGERKEKKSNCHYQ